MEKNMQISEDAVQENLVSIVMPSYNTEKYIEASIKSIQEQTYKEWELIIVDDCSTDKTDQVIEKYLNDSRIRYFKNEKNSGAAVSRNRALREARGKWIAFLDSDDTWEKEKLELQLKFMKEKGYKFTYTDYRIELNGQEMPFVYTGPDVVNKRRMYNYCYFSTITVMYDREYVGLIQIEDIRKNNDYAMWLKIIEKADCYRFPKCMSTYVKHDNSISSGSKIKLIRWHYILFRKALGKNPLVSWMLTANNMIHGVIKKIRYKVPVERYRENNK